MKKMYKLLLPALLFYSFTYGQNTFPPNGNVAIGINNPLAKLHLDGPLDGSISVLRIGSATPGNINVPFGAATGGYNIDFQTWRDIIPEQIGARIRAERINNYIPNNALKQGMDLVFYTSNGHDQEQLTEKLRIRSDGNVGMGIFNPSQKLSVNGSQLLSNNGAVNGVISPTNGNYLSIEAYNSDNTTKYPVLLNPWGGDIGIGTTDTRGYKLAVAGNAIAESITVKVQSQWPDYVFKPTYKLPSLNTVKAYIGKNRHLPDMPSEAEVAKDGVNLGEMVKLQTKKIEELTLYLIEQNKQLVLQQKQISHQARLLKLLRHRIK